MDIGEVNPGLLLLFGISEADNALRYTYGQDVTGALGYSLTIAQFQQAANKHLEELKNKYIFDSMSPDPSASAEAKADQTEYDIASRLRDTKMGDMQNSLKSQQTQIDLDNTNREANFGLSANIMQAQNFTANLLRRGLG